MNSSNVSRETFLYNSFKKINYELSKHQIHQFLTFYDMLTEKNKVINLTAITDYEEVVRKHFIDSVMICNSFSISGRIIDVGSGAGFPGIPLKILFPDINLVLLDSLNKRVQFLNDVIKKLDLKNITAIHMRAEDAGRTSDFREKFDICVSRAVANLSSLSEYCIPFVKREGYFISYKSSDIKKESAEAKNAIYLLGGKISEIVEMRIPDTDIERSFVIVRKERGTPSKYPRKAGIPSKNPLIFTQL